MGSATLTDPAARAPVVRSRLRVALGTFIAIEATGESACAVEHALEGAFAAIATVERLMHPQRTGSDLTRLARETVHAPVTVHPWTWELLELSQRLHLLSEGLFDPCLAQAPGRMPDVELLGDCAVRARAQLCIDLGGIAKGFAVDQALTRLRAGGCSEGLVNAGGDLAAFGGPGRLIRCRCGHGEELFELRDAALASSDTAESARPPEHRGYYHGVDRAVGVSGRSSITAPKAAWADALTKCALLSCGTRRERLLRLFGAREVAVCRH